MSRTFDHSAAAVDRTSPQTLLQGSLLLPRRGAQQTSCFMLSTRDSEDFISSCSIILNVNAEQVVSFVANLRSSDGQETNLEIR